MYVYIYICICNNNLYESFRASQRPFCREEFRRFFFSCIILFFFHSSFLYLLLIHAIRASAYASLCASFDIYTYILFVNTRVDWYNVFLRVILTDEVYSSGAKTVRRPTSVDCIFREAVFRVDGCVIVIITLIIDRSKLENARAVLFFFFFLIYPFIILSPRSLIDVQCGRTKVKKN